MTVRAKAERVCKIAKIACEQADENIGIVTFVELGNGPSIHRLFKAGEAHVPVLIRGALLERLTMALMRLYDSLGNPRLQADPLASERDSLPVALALLADPQVRKAATVPNGAEMMATAITLWAKLAGDARIARLRDMRNYMMAHTITSKWEFNGPHLADLLGLAEDTGQLVEALASGCGVVPPRRKDAKEVWARLCADYWARLVRTSPVQDS